MKKVSIREAGIIIALIVVVLVISIWMFHHSTTAAPIASQQGNSSLIWGVGTHGNISSENKALTSGVKYYRVDINLSSTQAHQIMQESRQHSAQYLGILDYETLDHYTNMNGLSQNASQTLAVWNASVEMALQEYPEVKTWEIWNEPWLQQFHRGYMNGSALNYFQMTKSAYQIIKAKDPNATVVCFGGAPIGDYNTFLFYSQVWAYGAANYCDAISIHAYTGDALLNQSNTAQIWSASLSAYWNMTHKPIWITETGMPASSVAYPTAFSQQLQNEFLMQENAFFSGISYVKRVYWYDLWGLSDGAAGNDYGLLNLSDPYSGKPNVAWSAFLNVSTSR